MTALIELPRTDHLRRLAIATMERRQNDDEAEKIEATTNFFASCT
jgi:hypothetical protein